MKIYPADAAFSWCVRERSQWKCQHPNCGKQYPPPTTSLHCAHFVGRGKWSTRFHPENAASFCYGHHRYLDTHPLEKYDIFVELIGQDAVDDLILLSNQTSNGIKKRLPDIARWYRRQLEIMQLRRADGVMGHLDFHGYWV